MPPDAILKKLHPDGVLPAYLGIPGGGLERNVTATGRLEIPTVLRSSNSIVE